MLGLISRIKEFNLTGNERALKPFNKEYKVYMYPNVHSITIYNSQDMEANEMSAWQKMAALENRYSFSRKSDLPLLQVCGY